MFCNGKFFIRTFVEDHALSLDMFFSSSVSIVIEFEAGIRPIIYFVLMGCIGLLGVLAGACIVVSHLLVVAKILPSSRVVSEEHGQR